MTLMSTATGGIVRWFVVGALTLTAAVVMRAEVQAQQAEDDGAVRVFIFPQQAGGDAGRALGTAGRFFESVLSRTGHFKFAGTQDQESMFSQCGAGENISPAQARECQLAAARRTMVKWVFDFKIESLGGRSYAVSVDVWNPPENHKDFADVVEVEATSMGGAARKGLELSLIHI